MRIGRAVPAVLAGGNHAASAAWRRLQAMQRTAPRRPDLWKRYRPSKAEIKAFPPLAARTHLALVHHQVVDRVGTVISTALSNFYNQEHTQTTKKNKHTTNHLITPVTSQRDKA